MSARHAQSSKALGRRQRGSEGPRYRGSRSTPVEGRGPGSGCLDRRGGSGRLAMRLTTPRSIRSFNGSYTSRPRPSRVTGFTPIRQGLSRRILAHAYGLAKANGGAPGVDGVTFEQVESAGLSDWLARLQEDLRTREYQPAAVRRVYIPKPGGGERPLGIPTISRPGGSDGHRACVVANLRSGLHRRDVWIPTAAQRAAGGGDGASGASRWLYRRRGCQSLQVPRHDSALGLAQIGRTAGQ